jgi:hypothetical protein
MKRLYFLALFSLCFAVCHAQDAAVPDSVMAGIVATAIAPFGLDEAGSCVQIGSISGKLADVLSFERDDNAGGGVRLWARILPEKSSVLMRAVYGSDTMLREIEFSTLKGRPRLDDIDMGTGEAGTVIMRLSAPSSGSRIGFGKVELIQEGLWRSYMLEDGSVWSLEEMNGASKP